MDVITLKSAKIDLKLFQSMSHLMEITLYTKAATRQRSDNVL